METEKLLPRDVSTHWNSTFDMLSVAIDYRAAIDKMTDHDKGLRSLEMSGEEWKIATQLRDVLKVC